MTRIPTLEERAKIHVKKSGNAMYRRGFPKCFGLGLILLAAVIVLTGSVLYGQEGNDALFIDERGNVSVGGRIRDKTGWVIPVGTILPYAGENAPDGWLPCDGGSYDAKEYAELNAVIGDIYGRDGEDKFRVPDLRGRCLMGLSGSGNFTRLGQTGGAETHRLTVNQIPSHTHTVNDPGHKHPFKRPRGDRNWHNGTGNTWWGSSAGDNLTADAKTGISIQEAGGGQEHSILDPYLTINFIIKH